MPRDHLSHQDSGETLARNLVVTGAAHRIRERFGSDAALTAALMRAAAHHLNEQADEIDPPWTSRLPTLGDWIGGLCLMGTFYLLLLIAGVLS